MSYEYLTIDEALIKFESSYSGLSEREAEIRLERYGENKLKKVKEITIFNIFFNQFKNILLFPIMIACAFYFLLNEIVEGVVILTIIFFILIIGTIQEFQAENALQALKKLQSRFTRVIRNSEERVIPIEKLVPGDIVLLKQGDIIPADCRLIESYNLKINEATLTGESIPISKDANGKNIQEVLVYSGTAVMSGTAKAVVISTGEETEFGKIAKMLKPEIETTPLQKQITRLTVDIAFIVICVVIFATFILFFKGYSFIDIITTSSALLIAGVPEALPFVMILTLSLGILKMSKKNSIIRKIIAVETLGSVNYICTDKTGTLTKNEIIVKKIWQNGKIYDISGKGYEPYGKFYLNEKEIKPDNDLRFLLKVGVECNDAIYNFSKNKKEIHGDPTEIALLVVGKKAGIDRNFLRIHEIPYDSERRMMSVICENKNKKYIFTKGALESVLKKCSKYYKNGKVKKLTKIKVREILKENERLSKLAYRILGFAYSELDPKIVDYEKYNLESKLIFLGFVCMIDPIRDNVIEAIRECKKAGIKVVMITGDNKDTAIAIAKQLEIVSDESKILTGSELDKLSEKEFLEIVENVFVYARVTPAHKYRIVEVLQKRGNIVAVTGDGVNDAPALQKATIGVAMGKIGNDVAKESSKMIIQDDNFATIVDAIKEGRNIYNNIKKFTFYLLSCNFTEILFVVIALIIGLPLPLLALQIIWLNLITDEIPAMGLSVDPPYKGIMEMKPRNPKKRIIEKIDFISLFLISSYMMTCLLFLFINELPKGLERSRTIIFATFALFELFNVLNCKSLDKSIFKVEILKNKQLLLAILASFISLLLVIYIPSLQIAFKTIPLTIQDWVFIFFIAITIIPFCEIVKFAKRRILKI